MREPIFEIQVELDDCSNVKGEREEVNFLRFHGTAESPYFKGKILSSGVDCQKKTADGSFYLSARYVLEGEDCTGTLCKVFIENNGAAGEDGIHTVPTIVTDSEVLAGLVDGELYGEVQGNGDNGVTIRIYEKTCAYTRETLWIEYGEKKIYGELYRPEKEGPHPLVIMSHGFNGSSKAMRPEAECVAKRGVAVFCYDFCSGGVNIKSSGETTDMTIPSEQEDLKQVVKEIRKLPWVRQDKVYLFGSSQGGFVTGLTAPEIDDIAGVFLAFPAFCIPDDWKNMRWEYVDDQIDCMGVRLGKCFRDTLPDYDVFEKAAGYQGPVTIFHGDADTLVNLSYSERLKEAYTQGQLIVFPGEGHGFGDSYLEAMAGVCTHRMKAK